MLYANYEIELTLNAPEGITAGKTSRSLSLCLAYTRTSRSH